MELRNHILDIRNDLTAGKFPNEASVSLGVVLRLLQALDWPIFNSEIVSQEYSVGGRRVDFALCHPPTKPLIFIEVKQVGQSEGADRQLFEYVFHAGVPLAVLTDGQEWHFYLPGEQGNYQERRVYKLDLLRRDINECEYRLRRYLDYNASRQKTTIDNAKQDYRDVDSKRQIELILPKAYKTLITEKDETLISILSDKVESLCGYRPEPELVINYLSSNLGSPPKPEILKSGYIIRERPSIKPAIDKTNRIKNQYPSSKEKGRLRRKAFISQAQSKGIYLSNVRGVIYTTSSGRVIGIATAEKRNQRWFLGLPIQKYDFIVLICVEDGESTFPFVIPAEAIGNLDNLSQSKGDFKFHVSRRSDRFFLCVPQQDEIELTKFLDGYEIMRM